MVLTVSFALSLVTGPSCHHRQQVTTCQLDASVGASGPHDFAVRLSTIRPRACNCTSRTALSASTASRTNVCDDRETPLLVGARWNGCSAVLGRSRSRIFFDDRLDRANQFEMSGEIRFWAQAICGFEGAEERRREETTDLSVFGQIEIECSGNPPINSTKSGHSRPREFIV
jgi:hypothetical protein